MTGWECAISQPCCEILVLAFGPRTRRRRAGATRLPRRRARRSGSRRLRATDLRSRPRQLDEVDRLGCAERSSKLHAELDALVDQLTVATGLGGRARSFPADDERARSGVTKAIRRVIDEITSVSPALGATSASHRHRTFLSVHRNRSMDRHDGRRPARPLTRLVPEVSGIASATTGAAVGRRRTPQVCKPTIGGARQRRS